MVKKNKYDWKKTAEKAGRVLAYVLVLGALAYITEQPALIFLAPVLEGARDYLKHKN